MYMTVKDVADHWGTSARRVHATVDAGLLMGFRVSKRLLRFRAEDVPPAPPELPRPVRVNAAAPPQCGVYMLFTKGALIYVGRSTSLHKRLTSHRCSGRQFDEVRIIPCDAERADWLEAELIRTLQPSENIKRFERRARKVGAALQALSA